ncbi:uncharacterized protein [Watersipora subatra]|uniref:uncharacterized protein n=1 Tax=Watersipora subatra TaxID=2589382 RepID=UPI00355B6A5B
MRVIGYGYDLEHHTELLKKRGTISIIEYKKQRRMFCSKHSNKELTLGCKQCKQNLCLKCVKDMTGCEGHPHSWSTLKSLTDEVGIKTTSMKEEVLRRQWKLIDLYDKGDELLNIYEEDTQILLEKVETVRDAQINEIKRRYSRLASELLTIRQVLYSQLKEFLQSLTAEKECLTNDFESLLSEAESCNQDKVADIAAQLEQFQQLYVDPPIPSLTVEAMVTELNDEGTFRDVELSIHTRNEIFTVGIDEEREQARLKFYKDAVAKATFSSDVTNSTIHEIPNVNLSATGQEAPEMDQNRERELALPKCESADLPETPKIFCSVCEDLLVNHIELPCEHTLCKGCWNGLVHAPAPNLCPSCKTKFEGTQPKDAKITIKLPKFAFQRRIRINYSIPDGIQEHEHPNPGEPYKGKSYYLSVPNNPTGLWTVTQIKEAFEGRAIFKVTDAGSVDFNILHPESSSPNEDEVNRLAHELKLHLVPARD